MGNFVGDTRELTWGMSHFEMELICCSCGNKEKTEMYYNKKRGTLIADCKACGNIEEL